MSKKGTKYICPRKQVRTPADILALGQQGMLIAQAIRSHYDSMRRQIERADHTKTL